MAEPAQQEMFGLVVVGGGQEPLELDRAVAAVIWEMTLPLATSKAAYRLVTTPWRVAWRGW